MQSLDNVLIDNFFKKISSLVVNLAEDAAKFGESSNSLFLVMDFGGPPMTRVRSLIF